MEMIPDHSTHEVSGNRLYTAAAIQWLGLLALFFALHNYFGEAADFPDALQNFLYITGSINPLAALFRGINGFDPHQFRTDFLLIFLLLFAVYFVVLYLVRRGGVALRLRTLLLAVVLFSLPLLVAPRFLSSDVYGNIVFGRMMVVYDVDPAVTPPTVVPNEDPFKHHLSSYWINKTQVYGPTWALTERLVSFFVEHTIGAAWYVLVYRLLGLGLHLLSCLLIWRLLGEWKPEQQSWGTLLFAWNPLLLIESIGNAHNDALMLALILRGLFYVRRGRWPWAVVAIVAAGMVKWIALLLLPMLLIVQWRQTTEQNSKTRQLLILMLLVCLTVAALAVASGSYRSVINALTPPSSGMAVNSFAAAFAPWMQKLNGSGRAVLSLFDILTKVALLGGLIAGCLMCARRPSLETAVRAVFYILLATLCLSGWFWPWYVMWLLALAPLLPWRDSRLAVLLAATSTLIYTQMPWGLLPFLLFLPLLLFVRYKIPAADFSPEPGT